MSPPALGVGLTFHPGLEGFLEAESDLVDVLELEPQTLWLPAAGVGESFGVPVGALERIAAYPQAKLVHSVGIPVGGSRLGDERQVPLLRESISRLGSPWCSEHLSFSVAEGPDGSFFTGFLLPPRQTWEGVECAVGSVRRLANDLQAPLAIETGVSYFRPRVEELRDGQFVAAVAEAADSGILLDVHNIWTNELNGRQPVQAYLDDLPLERVWELHLAGGQEHAGYWLDAHSGAIPPEVLRIAANVIPSLPNLGALIFELMPEQISRLGDDGLRRQLVALHELWGARSSKTPSVNGRPASAHRHEPDPTGVNPRAWENTLGALAIGQDANDSLGRELAADPGIDVVRSLVTESRAGMLTASLRLTMRLLLLDLGEEETRAVMQRFWSTVPPEPFGGDEGLAFGEFLHTTEMAVPYLGDVLAFELAVLRAAIYGETETVHFTTQPDELLTALAEGRLPEGLERGEYELEVSA